MADLLSDNFVDVPGTPLIAHRPDVNLYGDPWRLTKGGFFEIADDGEGQGRTILRVNTEPKIAGGIIRLGMLDVQALAIAKPNNLSDKNPVVLALRVDDSKEPIDYYSIRLDASNQTATIDRVVKDKITVLALDQYISDAEQYEEFGLDVVINTLDATALDGSITLGPVTDTQLNWVNWLGIFGGGEGKIGQYWRYVIVQQPEFNIEVSDTATATDTNNNIVQMIGLADTAQSNDALVPVLANVPISETGLVDELTILNENQFRIKDYGNVIETVVMPNTSVGVNETRFASETLIIRAYTQSLELGLGNDIKEPISTDIQLPESGSTGHTLALTFDIIQQSDFLIPLLPRDNITIFVDPDIIIDSSNQATDSLAVRGLLDIIDSGLSNSGLSIVASDIQLLDGSSSIGKINIQNQVPLIADFMQDVFEVVGIENPAAIVEISTSQSLLDIIVKLESLETASALEQPLISQLVDVYDFGIASNIIEVLHFEIQRVIDAAISNENIVIEHHIELTENALGLESPDSTNILGVIDETNSVEKLVVVGNPVKRVPDVGIAATTVMNISTVVINDQGSVVEVTRRADSVASITDIAEANELVFVYDNKQQLVHILFSMKVPRILFLLNTKEEFDNENN